MPDAVQTESNELRDENKEMEERLWSLEMMLRKQSFTSRILLCVTPDPAMSTTSSGFVSASCTDTRHSPDHEKQAVITVDQLEKLEAETERLADLLGVMEEREEQLVEQVKEQQEARMVLETRVTRRDAADRVGDRMKKVLLLTAAFGAVHSALQHDLVLGSCTML